MNPSALPRCCAGHDSDTSAAPLVHTPPMPSPRKMRKTTNCARRVREAAREREDRIQQRRSASGARVRPKRSAIQPKPTPPAAAATSITEPRKPPCALVRPRSGAHVGQHEREEHDVERVEHPPEHARPRARAARSGPPSRHHFTAILRSARRSRPRPSSASWMRRASSGAPGVSPWTQMVSTRSGTSRPAGGEDDAVARPCGRRAATTASGSWMTAPGRLRGVSEPSSS